MSEWFVLNSSMKPVPLSGAECMAVDSADSREIGEQKHWRRHHAETATVGGDCFVAVRQHGAGFLYRLQNQPGPVSAVFKPF